MRLRFPDIPRRAAAVAVALACIAGIVSGVEEPSADSGAASPPQSAPAAAPATPPAVPDLDLDKLNRVRDAKKVANLFAPRTIAPPPAAVAPVVLAPPPPASPPPPPAAPPLPFRYFGKWIEGNRTVVFLWKDNEGTSAAVGDTLEGRYRIESMSDSAVTFTYLPLGSTQTLPIAAPN
jgi:hypothetical protein